MEPQDFLKRMLEIYSPSGQEAELANFLLNQMNKMGFNAEIDEVGNVIGRIGEGEPILLLCGHMDTVPGELPVQIIKGELTGRGACDAKSPLAVLILAASKFVNKKIRGTILVVGAVQEEGTSIGVKNIIDKGLKADYAIFGEPCNTNFIVIGYKGSLSIELEIKTEPGHPANPTVRNASEELISIWLKIKEELGKYQSNSKYHTVDLSIGRLNGTDSQSATEIRVRIPPKMSCNTTYKIIYHVVQEYCKSTPDVECSTRVIDATEPYESEKKSLLIDALMDSIKEITGKDARLIKKTGTGDMNIYGNSIKTLAVTYGPGDPRLDHTNHEKISIKQFLDTAKILEKTIEKLMM
ncbi:MAG: M20/M25/M40 family metallo-hydrolase [Candidatus Jordarchaeum sp.]|uniref:M20/M25/M40 family metallo-hydrolase n=1 Tax=Candidatus Jordarchaeum sp. TaxID=2823881 RepID=UPI00404A522F